MGINVESLNESPTPAQIRAIAKLCGALGIREELESRPMKRWEARNLIYKLREQLLKETKYGNAT
jgi:hypothetical protein